MRSRTTAVVLAAVLLTSCFGPSTTGPGFRWAPPEIRGVEWDDHVAQFRGTLTATDEFHGNRVYIVHLPDARIVEHYLPFVSVLDACAIAGTDDAYALLTDGRIVRTGEDLEAKPRFRVGPSCEEDSSLSLSPDGSKIALAWRSGGNETGHGFTLTLVDVATWRASVLRKGLDFGRPCWAPDGKSLFVVEPPGRILQCPLTPEENARPVASGRFPLLSEDGNWLVFASPEPTYRGWLGWSFKSNSILTRWRIGTSQAPETMPHSSAKSPYPLAVSTSGWILHQSEPDKRLPLEEYAGGVLTYNARGGIAVTDPASGKRETLFVGVGPRSFQWRWD